MKILQKNGFLLTAVLFLVVSLLGCSGPQKNREGGFSIDLPKTWKGGNYTEMDSMLAKFFQDSDKPERSFLYTNGSHGKLLIAIKKLDNKQKAAIKKELKPAEKFGKAKWVNVDNSADGTIVYKEFKALRRQYLYTVIISADKINNNYDDVYGQAYNAVLALKFIRAKW
jgi:hypothetical protein